MPQMLTTTRIVYNNFIWEAGIIIEVDPATQAIFLANGTAANTSGTDAPIPQVVMGGNMEDATDISQLE